MNAGQIIELLNLKPHPEGGHFVETLDTFTRQDGAVVATNRNTLFRFTPATSS